MYLCGGSPIFWKSSKTAQWHRGKFFKKPERQHDGHQPPPPCVCSMYVLCMRALYPHRSEDGSQAELELQMVVNRHMYSRNQIQVLCKNSQCSKLLSCLSSPTSLILVIFSTDHSIRQNYVITHWSSTASPILQMGRLWHRKVLTCPTTHHKTNISESNF